jgi:pimeloyl-CoA synthetase
LIPTPQSRGFFTPTQVVTCGGKQDQYAARQLSGVERMVKDQFIDHNRDHRVYKGERTRNGRRQFLNRAIEQLVHYAGVDNPKRK